MLIRSVLGSYTVIFATTNTDSTLNSNTLTELKIDLEFNIFIQNY